MASITDPMQAVRGLDRARWMSQFEGAIADYSMTQLCMVGAHDAATHNIDRRTPGEYAADAPEALVNITNPLQPAAHRLAADWARTQEHSIRAMLQLGVRYFDLRISPRGPTRELWLTHGLYSMPLSHLIEDVASFFGAVGQVEPGKAAEFPPGALATNRDVLVLDVQRLSGVQAGYGTAKIHHEFFRQIEPLRALLLKDGQSQTTPLRDLWLSGTRVIVLYPCVLACAAHQPLVLARASQHIRSEWFNRNDARDLMLCLRDELVRRRNSIMTALVMCSGSSSSSASPTLSSASTAVDVTRTHGEGKGHPCGEHEAAPAGKAAAPVEEAAAAATESPKTPRGYHAALSTNDALRQLHILQGVLTPSTADFIRMLMSPMPGTARKLEDFAHSVNSKVLTLFGAHAELNQAAVRELSLHPKLERVPLDGRNVLMMDFFAHGRDEATGLDAVQLCHFINVRRFGPPACAGSVPRPLAALERIVGSSSAPNFEHAVAQQQEEVVEEGEAAAAVRSFSATPEATVDGETPRASAAPDGESQQPAAASRRGRRTPISPLYLSPLPIQ